MPISSPTRTASFTGNASTTAFPTGFYFDANEDLTVTVAGVEKVLGTDYTVTGAQSEDGGTVTFGAAPASGAAVVITRSTAREQPLDMVSQGPFSPALATKAFDRTVVALQDVEAQHGGRLDGLDDRADAVEGRATALEDRAASLEGRATGLESRTTALEAVDPGIASENALASAQAAAASATEALGYRTGAAGSAADASDFASAASVARVAAEAARDAANATGKVYANTAAGLAATSSGEYFTVPASAANESLILYRNSSGVAVETIRFPSQAFVAQMGSVDEFPDFAWVVTDASGRAAIGVKTDGTPYVAKAFSGEYLGVSGIMLDASWQETGRLLAVVDSAGRVGLELSEDGTLSGKIISSETVESRGTRASLDERISQTLSPYGLPNSYVWGEWYLRETRQRLRKLALGESTQLVMAVIGDSWTQYYDRYCRPTWASLVDAYGDAGPGWIGFGFFGTNGVGLNGNVDGASIGVAFSAASDWSNTPYNHSTSPDICASTTTVAGTTITVSGGPAGCSAVKLFYTGTGGALKYRWNGGTWTALTLSGTGLQIVSLSGVPVGAWSLELQTVSGTVTLCGLDVQKSTDGVRFHKLGGSGSTALSWVNANATEWQSGLAALDPRFVSILLATNDQAVYDATTFKGYVQTMISRVRAAVPYADLLLVAPCENGAGRANPMSTYADALRELAATNKCAFLDLQYVFGEAYSDYAPGSGRPWFNADTIHPEPAAGGRAIADALVRLITQI